VCRIKNITLIGAGSVATNLAHIFLKNNFIINQVYSKTLTSAQKVSNLTNSQATNKITEINKNSDLYIISINDDFYKEIIQKLKIPEKSLILHTSGSININIFKNKYKNYGVFYPLQTFTKNKILDFKNIPLCIEANTTENLQKLNKLATIFSENINIINSNQRKTIHLSAVFACNFTNHMIDIAYRINEKNNINPDILIPLITETIKKSTENHPKNNQTGPAKRNDNKIISEHIDILNKIFTSKDLENIPKLYRFVSENIQDLNKD